MLIDLKSGRVVDRHREDLRFYALVETLARAVPPRSVASFSLEAGEAVVDHVSESMLWSSLRRTLDAIARMIELTVEGRPPSATAQRRMLPLPRAQLITWTWWPTARKSYTATASSARNRMQPEDPPNCSGVPTLSGDWARVPSP